MCLYIIWPVASVFCVNFVWHAVTVPYSVFALVTIPVIAVTQSEA